MIIPMLTLGLVLGLARARWWGPLIAAVLFVVEIAVTTDNAWYTWPASYGLAAVNAAAGWLLGFVIARGVAAGARRLGPGRTSRTTDPAHHDGPPPKGRAVA